MVKFLISTFLVFFVFSNPGRCQETDTSLQKFITNEAVNTTTDHPNDTSPTDIEQSLRNANNDDVYHAIDLYYKQKFMKSPEFIICIMLLVFALLICMAEIYLFIKGKLNAAQIIKLMIITLIIFSVLFLIASGYSNDQIAPAVGLLGTIAGYLLGRSTPSTSSKSNSHE